MSPHLERYFLGSFLLLLHHSCTMHTCVFPPHCTGATLTMKEMNTLKTQEGERISIIHRIAPKWQRFGNLLQFDSDGHTLDIIAKDHTTDGCVACCQEMVGLWLQGKGRQPVTWALLLELLEDMEQGWLVEQVKNALRINT